MKNLENTLKKLGLDYREVMVYISLVQNGAMGILDISRKTGLPRTTVYRLVEDLTVVGLLKNIINDAGNFYNISGDDALKALYEKRMKEKDELRSVFPDALLEIKDMVSMSDPETRIEYYKGRAGIRQMVWNVLDAKSTIRGYSYRYMADFVGKRFYQSFYNEFKARGLKGRDIYSDEYLNTTNRTDSNEPLIELVELDWQSIYVPPTILNINNQMDVYDNVVKYYNWHDGGVFGIEIYNQKIADLQTQIFDIVWDKYKEG